MTRTRAAILATILLIIYMLIAWWVMRPIPPLVHGPVWTEAEKRYVAKRMQHHGIDAAQWTPEIGYHFIRDGRICRL